MQSIGKFRLDGELGRGVMGIVFRGFDPAIGRPVDVSAVNTSVTLAVGLRLLSTAHAPATCGAAIEVPLNVAYLLPGTDE